MEKDIKLINNIYSQDVVLTIDGISKVIYHHENSDSEYYCNFILDGNYIIVYTTRIVDYEDPAFMTKFKNAKLVYDLSTNETLNLSDDVLYRITDMYLMKKVFSIEVVLSLLTGHCFVNDKTQINYFRNYITNFNENITDEEIRSYLIECYPFLADLKNIKVLFLNRRKIKSNSLSFHSMKQDIKEYNNYYAERDKQFRKKYMNN